MTPLLTRLVHPLRRLRLLSADQTGGTTIMIALSLPVLVGALGVGVDTGAWYIEKRSVQQMADAAALGGARAMADGLKLADAQSIAQRDAARNGYAAASGVSLVVHSPPTSGAYAGKTGAVEVVVTRPLPSLFSRFMLGSTERTLSGRAVAYAPPIQDKNLEVALVLDVSSSMASGTETRGVTKMEAQQSAANQLIDTVVQHDQSKFTSRVALAPFSASVNVGATYFKTVTNKKLSGIWSGVVERTGNYRFKDDVPSAGNKYFGDFKTKRTSAKGDYSELVQAMSAQTPDGDNTIQPLSSSTGALHADVNGLTSDGTTAAHLGLAWAWYMLSPKWNQIFSGANAPGAYNEEKTYKAIVILSDFDFNTYYESANGTANAQFEALCTQVKAAGVKIFTVGYHTVGSSNNARRVNCASPDEDDITYSYTTDTVDELVEAFHVVAAQAVNAVSDSELRLVE